MTGREYRQDDRTVGFCPHCGRELSGLTLAQTGFCEEHGWTYAEWERPAYPFIARRSDFGQWLVIDARSSEVVAEYTFYGQTQAQTDAAKRNETAYDEQEPLRTFPEGGSAVGQKNLSVGQPGRSPIMDEALRQKDAK